MNNTFNYKGAIINVLDEGKGVPIVLLHGYLESLDIWKPFSDRLREKFRTIRIDLPGHGKSGIIDEVHTMELLADVVRFVLDVSFIEKCILIGHSLGGYVTLAFADNYPNRLLGYCLFHSTPYPDSEEKKENRDKEIELVRAGKKDLIFSAHVPKEFYEGNLEHLQDEVNRARNIARNTPGDGIIATLEGMKRRPDRSSTVKNSPVNLLWILGEKDNYIAFNTMKKKIDMNDKGALFVLENSGHMGFLEEPDKSFERICLFVSLCES